jgi:hypothetical protein
MECPGARAAGRRQATPPGKALTDRSIHFETHPNQPQRTISFLALATPALAFMGPAPMTERR